MTKKDEKEKVGSILINKDIVDRVRIRAAIEGITIKELTERILGEACPPVNKTKIYGGESEL